ncbi:MAG: MarR family transcriptional regulator [Anaerolineaceae bacterium]
MPGPDSFEEPGSARPNWTLLSPHGLVLFFLAMNPHSTLREMSGLLELSERTLYTVIKDLSQAHMVRTGRVGRQNSYTVNADARFVHPAFAHLRLGDFLATLITTP